MKLLSDLPFEVVTAAGVLAEFLAVFHLLDLLDSLHHAKVGDCVGPRAIWRMYLQLGSIVCS